ncbi:MAG: hypothetical protein ASARMPRED_004292 [Alectoria sarmentosa]|nr:MAG: hypothetical protein ASARMPRED_004292 [Alectoria sarmentosa]
MGNHPSKAAADSQTSSTLMFDSQCIEFCNSSASENANDDTVVTIWECTTCGGRYVDPAPMGLFITPPPLTECMTIQTSETWTHANRGIVNLSVAGGATCDYVRVSRVVGETDLSEQTAKPEDAISATDMLPTGEAIAQVFDAACMKGAGEHGRISRLKEAGEYACDEEDPDDCEFWKAQCGDVDCIYEGDHCRYQCAMAELDEEPKIGAFAPQRGLRFRRLAR